MFNAQARLALPFSTYLLSLGQTINLTMAVLSVSVGALVGLKLAPTASLGTIPYGLQFLAVMVCTYAASLLMQKKGRAWVFYGSSVFLLLAGLLGMLAIEKQHFVLLCVSHFFLGMYIACANFYRFAATDNLPNALKSRAISWVVFGGVLAALVGPFLAVFLRHPVPSIAEFSLCYGAMSVFAVLNVVLIFYWQKCTQPIAPTRPVQHTQALPANEKPRLLAWAVGVGILSSSFGYLIMNLLMIQSSLFMKETCSFAASSQAIQWHVLAMFLPSFFTGRLIEQFGHWLIVHAGVALLFLSAWWGFTFQAYSHVVIELIILGLGWNFTYVAGSAMLAAYMPENLKHKIQGLADSTVALCATAGAFLPSVLYSHMGWKNTHMAVLVLCAVLFFVNAVVHFYVYLNQKHDKQAFT